MLAISEHWLHSNRLDVLSGVADSHFVFARSSNYSKAEFFGTRRGQGVGGGSLSIGANQFRDLLR